MARIIVASYVVRYPVGGYQSWALQWLVGFQRLGHDVYFVEKAGWPGACYDPSRDVSSDDCSYGIRVFSDLLHRFDLGARWSFMDIQGRSHGLSRPQVEALFQSADLLVDMGAPDGDWLPEAAQTSLRVLVDGEPGDTQMKMECQRAAGQALPEFDRYYTVGLNIGTPQSSAPTAGLSWHPIFDPVVVDLFPPCPISPNAPFTTIMSWQAHQPIDFGGAVYGQKDVEFAKFMDLPKRTRASLEVALAGKQAPLPQLVAAGWRVRDSHALTLTCDSFKQYVSESRGEFSVAKHVFVATNSGHFSERSAAYLASGRPVVVQETGFSEHLPCGLGLF